MTIPAIDQHRKVLALARAAVVTGDTKSAVHCIDMALDQISILQATVEDAWLQSQEANRRADEYRAAVEEKLKDRTI